MKNCSKGSIWRKWDLHVHTPFSILNNQFGDDFDNYVRKLFRSAIDHNVSAIGLTDYCLLDGYKKVVEDYILNDDKLAELFDEDEIRKIKNIAIFPNLEFRLDKLVVGKEVDLKWNRRTNFHVILSNELSPTLIQSEFLSRIQFETHAETGLKAERRALTKENLIEYGERLIEEHPEFRGQSALAVGICNASVNTSEIAELLTEDGRFKKNYLLALPCDEDLSRVSWNSAGHGTRKTLIQQSQLIFSSNKRTRSFLLGDYHDNPSSFRKEFGLPKACIWGSDAHAYETLFEPDEENNTWIKADLTFEGLKQVVFEPRSRVAIQDTCPGDKVSYEVIDSVRFKDSSGKNIFPEYKIELNSDLNSIIGGKSSGKSLLLYHISRTANKEETVKKCDLAKASTYPEFENESNFDFEITWNDNTKQSFRETNEQRPITYIPQLYINKLAEESGRDQLNELVLEILYQDREIKLGAEELFKKCDSLNESISTQVTKLVSLRHKYAKEKGEKEKIGAENSVNNEKEKIIEKIEKIKKSSGFTPDERKIYKKLSDRLSVSEKRRSSLLRYIEIHTELKNELVREMEDSFRNVALMTNSEESEKKRFHTGSRLVQITLAKIQKIIDDLPIEAGKNIRRANSLIGSLDERIINTTESLEKFSSKVKSQNELKGLLEAQKREEAKLRAIQEAGKKVKSTLEQGKAASDQLKALYEQLFDTYGEIEALFNGAAKIDNENITLQASLEFDHNSFDSFINCFDARGSLASILGDSIDSENNYIYSKDTHLDSIFTLSEKVRDFSQIAHKVRKSANEELILRNLLQDCFYISFNLLYKNDDIISMSPGKRGLVLLHLILHLSNSSHPILIDQPEDNLDNRTVYNELRDFIRERKERRQIIMVTHNANMVVSTDSECVIVANQAGQQHDMENEQFRFEYVSGAMECTFFEPDAPSLLKKFGIREHICEVLEGGQLAFEERERKYAFKR